jgi:hypothetical protein
MTPLTPLTSPLSPVRRVGPARAAWALWVPRPANLTAPDVRELAGPAAAVLGFAADVVGGATPFVAEDPRRAGAAGGTG